jgi:hypothetical protein
MGKYEDLWKFNANEFVIWNLKIHGNSNANEFVMRNVNIHWNWVEWICCNERRDVRNIHWNSMQIKLVMGNVKFMKNSLQWFL